jgi:effector-binding domain-containing protein
MVIAGAELAVATHAGHHSVADRTYGALAAHVAHHAIGVEGPICEYYLVGSRETSGERRSAGQSFLSE